ncbi:Di-copper centre-containing protein [Aspergillus ellipticus CBS 707.79]|uniref:Di-copper centre-containing protein n=1 Tax=Aspergillus ellipticus CBS 707.79 TaxID=1448320 RepID=A0A319EJ46_9EURO|nr:Di-copper centre-containing protein [Aspergillus ellipticus CBS 707.79]
MIFVGSIISRGPAGTLLNNPCKPCLLAIITSCNAVNSRFCPGEYPSYRQEWRMLSLEDRQAYIAAVQCLSRSPSRLGFNGTTRYDDFVYSHLAVSDDTHGTPLSLPWHRLYVQIYEDALRRECGFNDVLAYWDWTLDAASDPTQSPIWSSEYGLGGNGTAPENCLLDGPLADLSPQYPEPHCLKRNFAAQGMYGAEYTAPIVEDIVTNSTTYHEFRERLETGPHRFIHLGIGGEMPELWSSNDPVFFLHHAQIDRLWWLWQRQGANGRFRGYQGAIDVEEVLKFSGLADDLTAGDVVSTETDALCYKY